MTHLTVIYEPKTTCPIGQKINEELSDSAEQCEGGSFGVRPSDSNNWDFIVQGCKIHLSNADPSTFKLDFQQYGKAIPILNEDGSNKTKDHIKSDGSTVIYRHDYAIKDLRGKPVQANIFEPKRPKTNVIQITSEEVSEYLVELGTKINPQTEE